MRLNPSETRDLFNSEALRDLIVRWVEPLRETARGYFRESNVSEPYDTKVSRIYHELSILLEEHLSVLNFPRAGSAREFGRLFREVSEYYPIRLRRMRDRATGGGDDSVALDPRLRDGGPGGGSARNVKPSTRSQVREVSRSRNDSNS